MKAIGAFNTKGLKRGVRKITSSLKQSAVNYKTTVTKKDHPWGWFTLELIETRETDGDKLPLDGSIALLKGNGKPIMKFRYKDDGDKGPDFIATDAKILDPNEIANILMPYMLS